jgi:hypothetical protein
LRWGDRLAVAAALMPKPAPEINGSWGNGAMIASAKPSFCGDRS